VKRLLSAAVAAAVVAAPQTAAAWGATGHRIIGRAAAEGLPSDVPAFVRTAPFPADLGELAREPDRWKGAGQPHDGMRDAAHFIDLDDEGRVLGGPAFDALPETLKEYEAALLAVGADRYKAGWLPYALEDGRQQLVRDFALWRAAAAGERFADDPEKKAWYAGDRRRREAIILRHLGEWAHYVGDASQPHHTTIHYNGWDKDTPNPEGYTYDRVHGPFEGALVKATVSFDDVRRAMKPGPVCNASGSACLKTMVKEANAFVVPFYELYKAGGFEAGDPRGEAFVLERVAAGAAWLRDLTAQVWRDSGQAEVGWPQVPVAEIEAGRVDPWDALYGRD
jgi:hypothetical protein